jgi:hypothetical protein
VWCKAPSSNRQIQIGPVITLDYLTRASFARLRRLGQPDVGSDRHPHLWATSTFQFPFMRSEHRSSPAFCSPALLGPVCLLRSAKVRLADQSRHNPGERTPRFAGCRSPPRPFGRRPSPRAIGLSIPQEETAVANWSSAGPVWLLLDYHHKEYSSLCGQVDALPIFAQMKGILEPHP